MENAEKQIQHERALRQELEETREGKSKEIEASWQAVLDEKKDNWEAKEHALEEKLENQERLLNEIKASYEVSQRLGQTKDNIGNSSISASAAELEIVSSDLERTSQRLAEVEARNEQLRVELAQASSNAPQRTNAEDDPALARLQSENSSLMRKLDATNFEKDSETRKWENRIRILERDTQSLQQEKDELREKIHQWRDYSEVKRELEVFKVWLRLQFEGVDAKYLNSQSSYRMKMMIVFQRNLPTLRRSITIVEALALMVALLEARKKHLSSFYLLGIRNSVVRWLFYECHTKKSRRK